MGTESSIKAVIQAYRRGGSKFKTNAFKKSAANLIGRYGQKVEQIVQDHGEEAVIAGIESFLVDEYWVKNGLPLVAFLKAPHRWIPEKDGSAPQTTYKRFTKKTVPLLQRPFSSRPASPNEQESVFQEAVVSSKPSVDRLRAMRRNEGLVIARSTNGPNIQNLVDQVSDDKFAEMDDSAVDCWFDRVCEEFKSRKGIAAPVSSRRISE